MNDKKETTKGQRDFLKKAKLNENGYHVWKDSGRLVHRTKAYKKIYLENRDKYPLPFSQYQVHHIDGDKLNNNPNNLQIVERKEHRKIHGVRRNVWYKKPENWIIIAVALIVLFSAFYWAMSMKGVDDSCKDNKYDCGDFNSCFEAMEVFNSCGDDVNLLDMDEDGIPCEALCG